MSKHNELGKKGEIIATDFLKNKGHIILACNFRYEHKEIDIISAVDGLLIFSEVKTRSNLYFGFPEEAVTPAKQALIKEAAAYFVEENPNFLQCRFDVISIVLNQEKIIQIKHYKDAFY